MHYPVSGSAAWESAPDTHHHSHSDASSWDLYEFVSPDYLLGLACAGVQTLLSGFASIYFEMVLKRKAGAAAAVEGASVAAVAAGAGAAGAGAPVFSVWDRNIQLAVYSIGIYAPIAWFETGGNLFQGWTPLVWGIACLHATGGILAGPAARRVPVHIHILILPPPPSSSSLLLLDRLCLFHPRPLHLRPGFMYSTSTRSFVSHEGLAWQLT